MTQPLDGTLPQPIMKPDLDDAVQTLIETRDMCGNEAEALRDWQADNGKLTTQEIMAVHRMTAIVWEKHQRDAGVQFPIHDHERRHINRVIERGL